MARKGRDLFQLLELRSRGGAPSRRGRRSGWLDVLRGWVEQVIPKPSRSSGRSRRGHRAGRRFGPALSVPAVWLAVLGLACAGGGFAAGRLTASTGSASPLRTGAQPQLPEKFPTVSRVEGGAPDLSPEEEVKTISQYLFAVLSYPASQRQDAADLAYYLRENGLASARIRQMTSGGQLKWFVLLYVKTDGLPRQDFAAERNARAAAMLQRLKAVRAPSDAPRFATRIAAMSIDDLKEL